MPQTYSKDDLQVDSSEIATADKISIWKYLASIVDEISQDENDVNVELLIGANCAKALEPIEVIPSKGDGPYAMRTVLGWCVVGTNSLQ